MKFVKAVRTIELHHGQITDSKNYKIYWEHNDKKIILYNKITQTSTILTASKRKGVYEIDMSTHEKPYPEYEDFQKV